MLVVVEGPRLSVWIQLNKKIGQGPTEMKDDDYGGSTADILV